MFKQSILQKSLTFKMIDKKDNYEIYYTVVSHSIKTGNEKTIIFVLKDDEIVFVPKYIHNQFKMKQACNDFIEKELENVR